MFETILMMGHNIRFKEEIWKIIPKLSLSGALDMIIITLGGIKTEAATNMLYEMTTNLVSKHIMMALLV